MIPHVGIDLGTTFSCMSYIDEKGIPVVIKNSDGLETTPSVIYFDGKVAYVGKKANERKLLANSPIYEMVKRDIGNELTNRYIVSEYDYKAAGFSAIILKKFKLEAYNFFKKKGLLSNDDTAVKLQIPAVITVPAYFGDIKRLETRIAGIAAGFDVISIINEPTAAALTYGIQLTDRKRVLVFDLGGGTFDVTVLELDGESASVIATDGADQLGGKDWDIILETYLASEYERVTGKEVPYDYSWEIQNAALKAKYSLSDAESTLITLNCDGESVEVELFRERPAGEDNHILIVDDIDDKFYFEERSENLLTLCKAVLSNTFEKAGITWNDLDEVILAGGSSRMPMIQKMIEKLSGTSIKKNIPGFSYDTAISQGAALYGRNRSRVIDVTSKSIGIELKEGGSRVIQHLIKKNSPLPINITEAFPSEANAVLKVYEGEGRSPDECILRGRLELCNPEGEVKVNLSIDFNGMMKASVEANGQIAELRIKAESGDIDVASLTEKIKEIDIRL